MLMDVGSIPTVSTMKKKTRVIPRCYSMNHTQELFRNDPPYIYLTEAPSHLVGQAVGGKDLRDIICIIDDKLFYEDLLMVEGSLIEDTGLFVSAFFTTKDEKIDYCFQCGQNGKGEVLSTLVRVENLGPVDSYSSLFYKNNQAIARNGDLLEAQYMATYKEGKWFVLSKDDREGRLDCESQEVLSRAKEYVF